MVLGITTKIHVDPPAQSKIFKARPALHEWVDKELNHLVKGGVIQPVQNLNWAAPVIPVVKCNNSVCLCNGYKIMYHFAWADQREKSRDTNPMYP